MFLNFFIVAHDTLRYTLIPSRISINMVLYGRWAAYIQFLLRGTDNIPWLLVVFVIFHLVISSVIIVSVLGIKHKLHCVITALLIVSFPTLSHQFGFIFGADVGTLGLMLAVSAVYITVKLKNGYVWGGICLMLAIASSQAQIGMAAGLFIILLIKHLLDASSTLKSTVTNAARYTACGVLGLFLYFLSLPITLRLFIGPDATLIHHVGGNQIGQVPLSLLPTLIRNSFFGFFEFFTQAPRFFYVSSFLQNLYILLLFIVLLLLGIAVVCKRIYKDPFKFVAVILLLFCLPIALNPIEIAAYFRGGSDVLTIYQFVLALIFVMVLSENTSLDDFGVCVKGKVKNSITTILSLTKWSVVIILLLIGFSYTRTTALYYFNAYISHHRDIAFYNRLLARVETVEGFRPYLPVALIGSQPYGDFRRPYMIPEIVRTRSNLEQPITLFSNLTPRALTWSGPGWDGRFALWYMSLYFGVNFRDPTSSQVYQVVQSYSFKDMPAWPHPDSVAVIYEVIVVKLSE